MFNIFSFLDGYKTLLSALGLAGLGIWQISQGEYAAGFQSLAAALAAFGLKSAITKQGEEQKLMLRRMKDEQV